MTANIYELFIYYFMYAFLYNSMCPLSLVNVFSERKKTFHLVKSLVCVCVCAGSGCRAPSWCRWASTRSWTRRRCWRAGSPTSANRCRWPTTVRCSTAARCRETPAARPATATERRRTLTHTHERAHNSSCTGAIDCVFHHAGLNARK